MGGYIVRGPLGGLAWHHLQYVLALKQLGHDVLFVEDSDDYASCFDPSSFTHGTNPDYGLRFIADCFRILGLNDQWAYHDAHSGEWFGRSGHSVKQFLASADVFLNLSGMTKWRSWYEQIPKRVYIDTDPAFTQIRLLQDDLANKEAEQHTDFFTFATSAGHSSCNLPDDGRDWKPTRQPVVLNQWQQCEAASISQRKHIQLKLTTVMQWDSYASNEFRGQTYGMKSESFEDLFNLPSQVGHLALLELAMGSDSAPISRLKMAGWHMTAALEATRTINTYRNYIFHSSGEFSVAKSGYVKSQSGWFSERSINYLAAGKPVVLQDTGFSRWLPTGLGIQAFTNLGEAVQAIENLALNPAQHQAAAVSLAESYFSPEIVLGSLLAEIYSSDYSLTGASQDPGLPGMQKTA